LLGWHKQRSTAMTAPIRPLCKYLLLTSIVVLSCSNQTHAKQALAAVAANFNHTMKKLVPAFKAASGHELVVSYGSTGKLYAQIQHGAPYDIFLSADNVRTRLAIDAGLAVAGSQQVYAIGRLVLWSADPDLLSADGGNGDTLSTPSVTRIALANPQIAPYGHAALATLTALGIKQKVAAKLVQAESVAQAFQFVATRNAQAGFIALSQLHAVDYGGSSWLIPDYLHPPLIQEAVLLKRGENNVAAKAFLDFMNSKTARSILQQMGYKNQRLPQ